MNNKSALILAFDEFIGKKTEFDGNARVKTIQELKQIINFVLNQNIFYEQIDREIIEYLNSIEIANIDDYDTGFDETIFHKDNFYLLGGWIIFN